MSDEMILYNTEDGVTVIQLKARDGSAWLSQAQIAELFEVTPQAVTQQVRAIYEDGELNEAATCKEFLQVRTEGNREVSRQIAHYSLPMILAIGFRVRSPRGIQFRRWAAASLSEYLTKQLAGVRDDERHVQEGSELILAGYLRMRRLNAICAVALILIAPSCTEGQPPEPVVVTARQNAPPVSWHWGDRVKIEGKLVSAGENLYLIENTSSVRGIETKTCGFVRGVDRSWLLWFQANRLVDADRLVAVTGKTTERHPSFPTPERGYGQQRILCDFGMEADKIEAL